MLRSPERASIKPLTERDPSGRRERRALSPSDPRLTTRPRLARFSFSTISSQHICVAVEKATNNDVVSPKEKHVQTLVDVVRPGASIADVTFLVKYLNRQIIDATRWLQMLKTHILIHRLLHNCGDEFKEQLKRMQQWVAEDRNKDSRIKCLFSIRNWRDDSNVDANELSGWTRSYANYLEEYVANLDKIPRLDKMAAGSGGDSASPTALRSCDETELMETLPRVQMMMRRLLECEAVNENLTDNEVVIAGTKLLLTDSFKVYRMVNDGIIRLIDLFFEMGKMNAMKALDVYKRATSQGDDLERMYRMANDWPMFRETKFPQIENPPASFLQTMEEYARTASPGGGGAGGSTPVAPAVTPQAAAPAVPAAPAATPIDDLLGGLSMAPAPASAHPTPPAPAAPAAPATSPPAPITDIFAAPAPSSAATATPTPVAPSPLADPFAMGAGGSTFDSGTTGGSSGGPPSANPFGQNPFGQPDQASKEVNLDALYAQAPARNMNPFAAAGAQPAAPQMMGGAGFPQQQMMGSGALPQQPQMMMQQGMMQQGMMQQGMVMPGMQQQGYGMQGMQPQMGQQQMGMGMGAGMGVGAPQGQMMMQPGGLQGAPGGYLGAQQPQQQMGGMGTFSPPQFKQTSPGGQNQQQGAGGSPSLL